jgi:outer membrane protein TolC
LIAGASRAYAEEASALGALLEEARENNPELKSLRERVRSFEARARAEGTLEDPVLAIEMEELDSDRPFEISPGRAMTTKYRLTQMLPFPGKLSLQKKIALKEASGIKSGLRARELGVIESVKESYFNYSFLDESIRITEDVKKLLQRMSAIAEAKYATGQVSQQDVIKLNVEVTALTNEIITLEAEKGIAASRMKSLLDRPQSSAFEIPGVLSKERVSIDVEKLIDTALAENPEIKTAQAEAEAGEFSADLAKKNYYPDFMVGVEPMQRDGRFDNFGVMFQMNIPIWRSKYDNLSKSAEAAASSARAMVASEKNAKAFEVKSAALQVDAAERMLTLFETSLMPQTELSFESALRNYQAGKIDFLTLLDTERELKRIRLEYANTLAEYRKRVAALERVIGADLIRL